MENPKVIFPDVEVKQSELFTEISTSVRVAKEDGSGFYFWDVTERDYSRIGESGMQETLCRFNNMVYCAMVLGKLNEDLVYRDGTSVFRMDYSKETERERMNERMKRIMLKKLGA